MEWGHDEANKIAGIKEGGEREDEGGRMDQERT